MPTVKIYTTSTCPYCELEKQYLDQRGIKYEKVEVDNNVGAAQEMLEKSGQMGVPFTIISKDDGTEETILGFDKERLNQALGLN